jgi:hypothetical protein
LITELTKPAMSTKSTLAPSPGPTPAAMPLPHLDLPVISSRWIDEDGHELTDLVDPAVAGLKVSLRNGNDVEIAQARTDSAGSYQFDDIPGGDYTVVFTAPSGAARSSRPDDARPASYWPADNVVPTPVHLWLTSSPARFRLLGTLA